MGVRLCVSYRICAHLMKTFDAFLLSFEGTFILAFSKICWLSVFLIGPLIISLPLFFQKSLLIADINGPISCIICIAYQLNQSGPCHQPCV